MELPGWMFGRRKSSKAITKERLKLVLVNDRAAIPPELLIVIRNEIIRIVSRHITVDRDKVDVRLSSSAGETRLIATISLASRQSAQPPVMKPLAEKKEF